MQVAINSVYRNTESHLKGITLVRLIWKAQRRFGGMVLKVRAGYWPELQSPRHNSCYYEGISLAS